VVRTEGAGQGALVTVKVVQDSYRQPVDFGDWPGGNLMPDAKAR
jgi:hypothetical protein